MVTILEGDVRNVLKTLPDASVNCCVTSPPYWGLRDYGVAGQLGLERTPKEYVASLLAIFREVRRVLRDDGTVWLNIGDTYASGNMSVASNRHPSRGQKDVPHRPEMTQDLRPLPIGLKPKDLVGIPWRVAFALQADGWYLRSDIIWHKKNPMPESVTDRPTKSHEYIFLLAKVERYYYDAEAIAEPLAEAPHAPGNRKVDASRNDADQMQKVWGASGTRNRRSVWTVSTHPYKGAHFATFPPALILPCILAGCPPSGTVLDPFGGSGTTGEVAASNGRNAILIELNPEYVKLAQDRCGLFLTSPK